MFNWHKKQPIKDLKILLTINIAFKGTPRVNIGFHIIPVWQIHKEKLKYMQNPSAKYKSLWFWLDESVIGFYKG